MSSSYDGNNPQDSGVFVRMQEFAMAHPSTEEVFVTSVCGPMAGDLDTSAGFLEVRRWADERKDPKLERIRNLPLVCADKQIALALHTIKFWYFLYA